MKRKACTLILVVVFLVLSLTIEIAYAYSGSDYTSNSTVATKLDNLIQGKVAIFKNTSTKFKVGDRLNNSTTYTWASSSGMQCYAYAQAAYYYLFGDSPNHGTGSYKNSSIASGVKGQNTLSYEKLSKAGIGCGAYIRTTNNSSGSYNGNSGHSMIILSYNGNGITVLHGNSDGNGLISITSYSWSSFNSKQLSGRSRYVSHIIQPNETAYKGTAPSAIYLNISASDLNLTDTLTLIPTVFPEDANDSIAWASSDNTIATVSDKGVVMPLQAGKTVTITATSVLDSNVKASCVINTFYEGTDTLKFNSITYPGVYNRNDGGFNWWSSDGTITSDVSITQVTFNVYNNQGTRLSTKTANPNAKSVSMATYNSDIKLSAIKTNGWCYLEIIAEDAAGRKLNESLAFETVSSGNTTRVKFSRTYQRPVLSTVSQNKKYELYSSSYTWEEAKLYAASRGGHLVCIDTNEENLLIQELLQQVNAGRAWIGGFYNGSGYSWVTDENFSYTHWASGEPSKSGLNNYCIHIRDNGYWYDTRTNEVLENHYFVVEYDRTYVEHIIIHGNNTVIVGNDTTLNVDVLPSNADNMDVVFSSTNPEVATVDSITGTVTGITPGETIIRATSQDGSGVVSPDFVFTVFHEPVPVEDIKIVPQGYESEKHIVMTQGETLYYNCIVSPANADNKSVFFYSTDNDIASVQYDSDAIIANKAGTCTIIAVSADNSTITDSLTIEVKAKRDVLTNPDLSLPAALQTIEEEAFVGVPAAYIKLQEGLKSIGSHAFADCVELVQIYIPTSVVFISEDAFEGSGKFTIKGYSNSYAQSFADAHDDISFVALDQPEPEEEPMSISISGNTTVDVGKTTALTAQITPTSLPNRTVTWASSNLSVASVSSNGTVTGLAVGTVFITAISNYDPAYTAYVIITVNPTQTVPTESDWVPASEAPAGATITQTSWSYRESTESTASTMSGWVQDNDYWQKTGTGSTNYATFPSGYSTSNTYYKTFAKAPYTASNDGSTKREVTNAKAGYIYWHWMYSTVYASGTERRISSKTGYYNASGASGSGSEYYGYQYFYAIASAVDCPYLSNGYCCGANLPSYNCKSIIPSNADKSNTSGLGTDRFFRFEYYTSTYTDYQMIYEYHRDLEYQSTDPGNGENISNKVEYVKYLIQ